MASLHSGKGHTVPSNLLVRRSVAKELYFAKSFSPTSCNNAGDSTRAGQAVRPLVPKHRTVKRRAEQLQYNSLLLMRWAFVTIKHSRQQEWSGSVQLSIWIDNLDSSHESERLNGQSKSSEARRTPGNATALLRHSRHTVIFVSFRFWPHWKHCPEVTSTNVDKQAVQMICCFPVRIVTLDSSSRVRVACGHLHSAAVQLLQLTKMWAWALALIGYEVLFSSELVLLQPVCLRMDDNMNGHVAALRVLVCVCK